MPDEIRLPDLEVIRRFSIAVRREHAPVEEVVEALRTDLERIQRARGRRRPKRRPKSGPPARPARRRRR